MSKIVSAVIGGIKGPIIAGNRLLGQPLGDLGSGDPLTEALFPNAIRAKKKLQGELEAIPSSQLPANPALNPPASPTVAPRVGGDVDTPTQRARRASTRQRAGTGRRSQTLLTGTLGAPQFNQNVRTSVLGG